MINTRCKCGRAVSAPESQIGQNIACEKCGQKLRFVSAEQLPESAGAGDFDAVLIISSTEGEQRIHLGGVFEITIGKLPDENIVLPGQRISRTHCKLLRLDFGPSRWEIQDNNSTNGLFVNEERVQSHELKNGDQIVVGENAMQFVILNDPFPDTSVSDDLPVAKSATKQTTAPAPARGLNYAAPQSSQQRLLGDCDISWVMHLRNASTLMVWTININFISIFFLPHLFDPYVAMITSLMSFAAAWLLTMPEPNAPESQSWISIRLILRAASTITVIGELAVLVGGFAKNAQLVFLGVLLAIMIVPQTGLFLFYLRRLALRLPNDALALNIAIVMIGLPTLLAITVGAAFFVATSRSPALLILTGISGLIGLVIFRIWYLILLIWFNKSFS